jgi:hypothetical protein
MCLRKQRQSTRWMHRAAGTAAPLQPKHNKHRCTMAAPALKKALKSSSAQAKHGR